MKKENKYTTEDARLALAKEIAAQSIVMLKNDNMLPLKPGTVAMVGQAVYEPNLGGMGSGSSFMNRKVPEISKALLANGLMPETHLNDFYTDYFSQIVPVDSFAELKKLLATGVDLVASGAVYEIFGRYKPQPEEILVPEDLMHEAAKQTDTAIYVFGRSTGGEECDRYIENDYELLESEKEMIALTCRTFKNVVMIINTNGVTDLSWLEHYPAIKAVLFIGAGGEAGPEALADVLAGKISPSGKLAFTIAGAYADYPTAKDFSFDKQHPENILEYKDYGLSAEDNGSTGFEKSPVTVYRENLYVGYRYFDSFGLPVLYPFGYGLSYVDFEISDMSAALLTADCGECAAAVDSGAKGADGLYLHVHAAVKNNSPAYSGMEVVQVYVSSPQGELEQPYQAYKGCVKTGLLAPGAAEEVCVKIPVSELASYDECMAAWVLEAGTYIVRVGCDSRNTHVAAKIVVNKKIVVCQLTNCLTMNPKNKEILEFMSAKDAAAISYATEAEEIAGAPVLELSADMLDAGGDRQKGGTKTLSKSYNTGVVNFKELLSAMSDDELMALAVGYGQGVPFASLGGAAAPCTIQDENGVDITTNTHPTGTMGYVSPAIEKYGLPSAYYKDGPASCGKIAWPTAMTMACCFNEALYYAFGSACAAEAQELQVDSWLAPALNLHRSPIGGRNFEYFSEDPYVAGVCGMNICKGALETTDVTCCPKHFAINEQETYRRGSMPKNYDAVDSVITERAARELYLKPFEMTIKNAPVYTVMTAFNKINGTFSAGSYDLCTQILRHEWHFDGVVVTDWGDMDYVVDGADAVAAGNDIVMPGGPPVIAQIKKGFEDGRVTREQLETAIGNLLTFVTHTNAYQTYCREHEERLLQTISK